ncbi:hypothetical protein HN51_048625 [Arachis hypogaea]
MEHYIEFVDIDGTSLSSCSCELDSGTRSRRNRRTDIGGSRVASYVPVDLISFGPLGPDDYNTNESVKLQVGYRFYNEEFVHLTIKLCHRFFSLPVYMTQLWWQDFSNKFDKA